MPPARERTELGLPLAQDHCPGEQQRPDFGGLQQLELAELIPEMPVTVIGPAYFGPGRTGCDSYDPFQVAVLVERDEVRVVSDDKVLAGAADSARKAALHGGLEVHGWLV